MTRAQGQKGQEKFERKIIAKDLEDPWNIIYGPDGHLWVTESKTYKVLRINPSNGKISTLIDLSSEKDFPRDGDGTWPQGGLMGMALHPDFLDGIPFVYLAYVHQYLGSYGEDAPQQQQGSYFKTKIVRYSYDEESQILSSPMVIIDSIPGSNDHNGGRLIIAKVEGQDFLFYSVGDMGAGQFNNGGRINHSQEVTIYEGKILRFHLEPTEINGPILDWIPDDNPFNAEIKSAVWSLGLRNTQGLATVEIDGEEIIYSSDHGPFSDDEINIIIKGGNYGHPLVVGYAEGNYNGLAAAVSDREELPGYWNTSLPLIESEEKNARKLINYQDPIFSFFPSSNSYLREVAEQQRRGESAEWDAVAHSGIAAYTFDAIPGWKNSLLVSSLKNGCIYRLKLSENGDRVIESKEYFAAKVRYRDIAVSADGLKIYAVTDKSFVTSGPTEEDPQVTELRGAIIEFSFEKE